jgi:hypothetical protein
MRRWKSLHPFTLLAAAALLCLAPPASAQHSDDEVIQKVHKVVKTDVRCDGEDCPKRESRVVIVDGDVHAIDGDRAVWIDGDAIGKRVIERLHGPGGLLGAGFLGVMLTELTPELRVHFGVPEETGVLVAKVIDDSPAQRAGLRVGDIVTLVDNENVGSSFELAREIRDREEGEIVTLEVWRDGRAERLDATVEKREGSKLEWHPRMHPRIHLRHGSGDAAHHVEVICDGGDCAGAHALGCDGAEDCDLRVLCEEGACECTVNGESADCAELGVGGR